MEQIKQETIQETDQETTQTHDQDTSYHALDIYDYTGDYDVSDIETHTTRVASTRGPVSCVLFIGLLYFLVMIVMIVNDAYQRLLREDEGQAGYSAT